MTALYFGLTLVAGFAAGFLTCLILARSKIEELASLFEPLGYKFVDGEWTRPDDPAWKHKRSVGG